MQGDAADFYEQYTFQGNLGTRFHITKYPTLKYVRNGIVAKREYRGKRDVDAFIQFIKDQTTDHITEYSDLSELTNLDVRRLGFRNIMYVIFDRHVLGKEKTSYWLL